MQKKIARLHIDDVKGYGAYARCYALEPVLFDGPFGYGYLTIVVRDSAVEVVRANGHGRPAELSVKKHTGSFIPEGNPHERDDHREGCFTWALAMAGYELDTAAVPLPPGLDYNPDEIPEEYR